MLPPWLQRTNSRGMRLPDLTGLPLLIYRLCKSSWRQGGDHASLHTSTGSHTDPGEAGTS